MMIDRITIERLLNEYTILSSGDGRNECSAWFQEDDAVRDYVLNVLEEEESYDDIDTLIESLVPFVGEHHKDQLTLLIRDIAAHYAAPASASSPHNGNRSEEALGQRQPNGQHEALTSAYMNIVSESTTPISPPSTSTASVSWVVADDPPEQPSTTAATPSNKPPTKRHERRQHSRRERNEGDDNADNSKGQGHSQDNHHRINDETPYLEDEASAWQDCVMRGVAWGGRGHGGRGAYAGSVNSVHGNIHLDQVSISVPNGTTDILQNTTMDIVHGHRYGLIGRNGCGKSTLLKRLAQRSIPGMPHDIRVLLVQQQIDGSDQSAIEVLLQADVDRLFLLSAQAEWETKMESSETTPDELAEAADRLAQIVQELDATGANTAEDRALNILTGLQFTNDMIHGPTRFLSGGWRMRLALARALFVSCDLLLLDECTNHLDLYGLHWLIDYLSQNSDRTIIVVSHDRVFLDAVCTDIVVMKHQRLTYHVGNYSEYDRQEQERAAREGQILDAAERQRNKAQAFIQKQQAMANKKSADPNKQRQAKMIKEKKLDRIGNYREDGKRYKLRSLKTLGEDSIRLAEKVTIEVDEPLVELKFPDPVWSPGIAPGDPIVRLENFTFGFDRDKPLLLRDVTLSLSRGGKAALVGRNGCGKSTLIKLITGELQTTNGGSPIAGTIWVHPTIRIGYVSQYSVEELDGYSHMTVVDYADERFRTGKAAARIVMKASGSGNIRQYLGAFGLGGRHATQSIGQLSGGERMRLCFAAVMADEPHLLLLDESTNHVDIETLEYMSQALHNFGGSVLIVSHNQAFLGGFCQELWILDHGTIIVERSDASESFNEIFPRYRRSVLKGETALSSRRRDKAAMAKQATRQGTGSTKSTALL